MTNLTETLDGSPKINDTVRFIVRSVMIFFLVLVSIIAGCSMHSNTFDEARAAGRAELERAELETIIANHSAELETITANHSADVESIKAIERLVGSGTEPVAARCAILGWKTGDTVCLMATGTK